MKILIMLEMGMDPEQSLLIANAKKTFPDAEVAVGFWGEEGQDLAAAIRYVEVHGSKDAKIPEAFYEHKDAEILVGTFCPFSKEGLSVFDNLRVLGVERAGMENVDIEGIEELGIMVVNATGRNADSVSDFAIAMMMAENRKIALSYHRIMSGGFREPFSNADTMMDMRGKTVGLFGFGFIGKLVAEKLGGFHMNILVYDPYIKEDAVKGTSVKLVDKETLFRESDFLSVHARYTEDTYHVIGEPEISLMKKNAVFINTARAGLVDYEALTKALETRKIAGAALDVFENEPLESDSPLLKLDNVTLTAHIAGATKDAQMNSPRLIFERVWKVIAGEETPIVTPSVLTNEKFQEWRKNI